MDGNTQVFQWSTQSNITSQSSRTKNSWLFCSCLAYFNQLFLASYWGVMCQGESMRLNLFFLTLLSFSSFSNSAQSDALSFSRTACFGQCPVYQVYIFSDGVVVYNGEANVEKSGVHKFKFSPDIFTRLIQVLDEANFNAFQKQYGWGEENNCKSIRTDNPSISIKFQYAGTIKSIDHYLGCRGFPREQELKQLEKKIEEIIGIKQYIGT